MDARITAVPAPDAGGNALAATYHANDLVRSVTSAGTTRTYTVDPARRIAAWTDGVSGGRVKCPVPNLVVSSRETTDIGCSSARRP